MTVSPIRDSAGKLAITPGVWKGKTGHIVADCIYVADVCYYGNGPKFEANRALIAEAGTVTNATGRTLAELAALVRELRGVLEDVRSLPLAGTYPDGPCIQSYLMDDAIAALAKSEGI